MEVRRTATDWCQVTHKPASKHMPAVNKALVILKRNSREAPDDLVLHVLAESIHTGKQLDAKQELY